MDEVLGFVGTGEIAAAVIEGLSRRDAARPSIYVSPRNHERAERLSRRHGNVVKASSNQEVVDKADVVFLAVKPPKAREVLSSLAFRPGQLIVSLVSGLQVDAIRSIVADGVGICLAVPLPSAAFGLSPTVLYPANPAAHRIFRAVGPVFTAASMEQYLACCAVTGTIAAFYSVAGSMAGWLVGTGLSSEDAVRYISCLVAGSFTPASSERHPGDFALLAKQHSTEGGLNEAFLQQISRMRVQESFVAGLNALLQRVTQDDKPSAQE